MEKTDDNFIEDRFNDIGNFLDARNKYLLENDPVKWETRIHYFYIWSFLVANVFLLFFGALFNIQPSKNTNGFHGFMSGAFGMTFGAGHIVLLFYAFYQTYLPSQPIFYTPSQFFKRFFLFFGAIGFIFLNGFVFVFGGSLAHFRLDFFPIFYANIGFISQYLPQALAFGFLFSMVMLVCREFNFNNLLIPIGIQGISFLFGFILSDAISFFAYFSTFLLLGIGLIFSFNANKLSKNALVFIFNLLFLDAYSGFWFIFRDSSNNEFFLITFLINLVMLMLLAFNLNQMSAFPKKSSSFSLNFKNIFSNITNAIFSPSFLKKIDKYLVAENPSFWETKAHYVFYYSFILGNTLLFLLQNLESQNNIFLYKAIPYYWLLATIFYVVYQTYFSNHINYYTPVQIFWRFVGMCVVAGCFFSNWAVVIFHIKSFLSLPSLLTYNLNSETYKQICLAFLPALFFLVSKNNSLSTYSISIVCAFFLTICVVAIYGAGNIIFLILSIIFLLTVLRNMVFYQNSLIVIQNLCLWVLFIFMIKPQTDFVAVINVSLIGLFFYLHHCYNKAIYSPNRNSN